MILVVGASFFSRESPVSFFLLKLLRSVDAAHVAHDECRVYVVVDSLPFNAEFKHKVLLSNRSEFLKVQFEYTKR